MNDETFLNNWKISHNETKFYTTSKVESRKIDLEFICKCNVYN